MSLRKNVGHKVFKIMKWILLRDRMPCSKIDGEKVLICKLLNQDQKLQEMSIFPTNRLHLSNKDETWWMALPESPTKNIEVDEMGNIITNEEINCGSMDCDYDAAGFCHNPYCERYCGK